MDELRIINGKCEFPTDGSNFSPALSKYATLVGVHTHQDRNKILEVATTVITGSWMNRNLAEGSDTLNMTAYGASTYVLRRLSQPYKFTVDKGIEVEDIIPTVDIQNIPSPPLVRAPFGEQHDGTFTENPTSVIDNQMGNYRFQYDLVQTSGRKNNNAWFTKLGGIDVENTSSEESTTVLGHYDFDLPDRGRTEHVFVERFSAPGSSHTIPRGMLDIEGEEYSSYNSLNFRNLDVKIRLSEWLTKHFEWDTAGEVNGGPRENFHKVHRNVKYEVLEDQTCISNYDNFWVQHQIPQSGFQYSWINSSLDNWFNTYGCKAGFATNYSNLGPHYPDFITDPSSNEFGNLGLSNPMVRGFPFLNYFRDWDENNPKQYELITTTEPSPASCATEWSGNYIIGDDISDNSIWSKYESNTTTLNNLLLYRDGPYQHPSWKQVRGAENPAVISMRKNNIISVLDKPKFIFWKTTSNGEVVQTGSFKQTRSDETTNYIEPVVTWNKPMNHELSFGDASVNSTHTYSNNIESFSNEVLLKRVGFKKSSRQMYDLLRDEYMTSGDISFSKLKYSEYIFPKHDNSSLYKTRIRPNYEEVPGIGSNGYDGRSSEIRTFWKGEVLDRQRTLETAQNAFGVAVRNSSIWAMDHYNYTDSNSNKTTMRGELAWAGYSQNRGFVYNGDELSNPPDEVGVIGGSDVKKKAWISPRPMLQYIHNPNSLVAKEDGWKWLAEDISGNAPWQESYDKYTEDVKLIGQGYALVPEYRISEHMDYFIDDCKGNFRCENRNMFELAGALDDLGKSSTDGASWNDDFFKCYLETDKIKFIKKIKDEHPEERDYKTTLRLEIDSVKKLLPYNGFYPMQRTVQLGSLFYDSVVLNVEGVETDPDNNDPYARVRTEQAALQPFFAPGILFNTIKSGVAVDWAAYVGEYNDTVIDIRDKFLGSFKVFDANEKGNTIEDEHGNQKSGLAALKGTQAGKAIMNRTLKIIRREVEVGRVKKPDIPSIFDDYYKKVLRSVGKEYNRMYKKASIACNTEDFKQWCRDNNKQPNSKKAQDEFRITKCGDINWRYSPSYTLDIPKNVSSMAGKTFIETTKNNPYQMKSLASTILGRINRLPRSVSAFGPANLIGMNSPKAKFAEYNLEGTYLDAVPNWRIPFEGLVSISNVLPALDDDLSRVKMFYLSPSNYIETFEIIDTESNVSDTSSYDNMRYPYFQWNGKSGALYEMAMHNFLAEVPNFFLQKKGFTSFMSASEEKFKSVEAGRAYYMDVNLYTKDDFSMTRSAYDGFHHTDAFTTNGRYFGPAVRHKSKNKINESRLYIDDPAQAPYTPSYFYGTAKARLVYRPDKSGKPTLQDIHKNTEIQYINQGLDSKFAAFSDDNSYKDTPAYKGRMPMDASINFFGRTGSKDIKYDPVTFQPLEVSDTDKGIWAISTKFECPTLDFNTSKNQSAQYGVSGDPVGTGMWSGYGELPVKHNGLFMSLRESYISSSGGVLDFQESEDKIKYIVSLGIRDEVRYTNGNRIVLKDPFGDEKEITIGHSPAFQRRSFGNSVKSDGQARMFGLQSGDRFYNRSSHIRTTYTSTQATDQDPGAGMSGRYDIEANLQAEHFAESLLNHYSLAQESVPKPYDIANAICYHINYRYNTEEDFDWRATVRWVKKVHRGEAVGASHSNNVTDNTGNISGVGAIVDIEWDPNMEKFKSVYWTQQKDKEQKHPAVKLSLTETNTYFGIRYFGSNYNTGFSWEEIDSSKYLPFYPKNSKASNVEDKPSGSLISVCGFETQESMIGEVAATKEISEAIIMIPFVNREISDSHPSLAPTVEIADKNFFQISRGRFDNLMNLLAHVPQPGEKPRPSSSITEMIDKMNKYNLPPEFDFIKYRDIDPFVMYIFEFSETLDQQDLADIWQGLMPKCAKAASKETKAIEHPLDEDNFFEAKEIPKDIRWITFKVKKRARTDYYKVTTDSSDDNRFKFELNEGQQIKPDYSYNWPYDYFSLVELARVAGGINIKKEDK